WDTYAATRYPVILVH
nr:lipase A {N-terminal} [Chromobacterium viscosum, Peptide Partial, 15 aa] [Chromobacterium viscosum]AAB34665.1 lipase B {N-terminal} [Chromobacterium viscosum, Peptide Partial, 15 aa] [Chromobacterium viscosum]